MATGIWAAEPADHPILVAVRLAGVEMPERMEKAVVTLKEVGERKETTVEGRVSSEWRWATRPQIGSQTRWLHEQ